MKDKRFEIKQSEGSQLSYNFTVVVDKNTGVNYLFVKSGYGAGLTPLLDENGKPIITKE